MSKWDKDYINLCEKILDEGTRVENRTGIDTIKIPAHQFNFNLQEEFPILTTKQLFIRQAVLEMLWIYQAQSNDVRWLQDRDVRIWDLWMIDEDGNWRDSKNKDKVLKKFPKKYAHTIGTAYGYIVKKYKLIENLIDTIKKNPTDRRMIMSLWQNEFLDTAVLPSCVWSSEWDVTDGKLNCWVHQRSCDVPLGLPFNITQYAVLLSMIAKTCGLKAGEINWSIKDAHIYINQISPIKEQIERFHTKEDLKAPKLWLNPKVKSFFDYDNSKELKDVKLIDYKHHGKIDFKLAQ